MGARKQAKWEDWHRDRVGEEWREGGWKRERANERERERERVLGKQGESRKRGKRVVIPSCTPWLSQCIAMATDPETPCGRRAIGLCFPMIVIMYPRFR